MDNNKIINDSNEAHDNHSQTRRKSIYDGIKITKRGADILIAVISFTLAVLFIFALSKS